MTNTPPDWVLIEAAKRSEYGVDNVTLMYKAGGAFRALCDMIAKHEQKPVDRKRLCAEQARHEFGWDKGWMGTSACIRAIELYLDGYGE